MQRSKAISDELNELFETIENQAKEYAEAFSDFRKKRAEFDVLSAEVKKFSGYFNTEMREFADSTKSEINQKLSALKDQLGEVGELRTQYETVLVHKEEIEKNHELYKKTLADAEKAVVEMKAKANEDLMSGLNAMRLRMNNEIANVNSKVFATANAGVKRCETEIIECNKKIDSLIDYDKRAFKDIRADIDSQRGKISTLFKEVGSAPTRTVEVDRISSLCDNLSDRLDTLRIDFDEYEHSTNKNIVDAENSQNVLREEVSALRATLQELSRQSAITRRENSKLKILLVFVLIALLVVAVVALVV